VLSKIAETTAENTRHLYCTYALLSYRLTFRLVANHSSCISRETAAGSGTSLQNRTEDVILLSAISIGLVTSFIDGNDQYRDWCLGRCRGARTSERHFRPRH